MKRQKIIDEICLYLEKEKHMNQGYFCIYGSYATNSQNDLSDIDILYISNSVKEPCRVGTLYNEIQITVYKISEKHLLQDSNGKYGGFFCGKIFNPHIVFPTNKRNDIFLDKCVALFFSGILKESICKLDKAYKEDEILKNLINIYLELYPEYFAYIMRLVKIDNFKDIWKTWKKKNVFSLLKNDLIRQENDKFYYKKNISFKKFEKLKINYISRFWIFGAISHNSNLNFYDFYVNKNLKYIAKNKILKEKCEKILNIDFTVIEED